MDIPQALAFIREHHHTVLAVLKADGTPTLSPVDAVVDAEDRVVVSTRETSMKVAHLRRDPRAWLCTFTERFYGDWVLVEADVEIVSLPDAMEPLVDYYRRAAGEHQDWDDYRKAMERDQRCILRMRPRYAGPNKAG